MKGILGAVSGSRTYAACSIDGSPGFYLLALLGAVVAALTLATPFAIWTYGDNAFMAMAIATGLAAIGATVVAERARSAKALWLIVGVAVLLRGVLLFLDPLLSTDVYRYVWDGKVQAAGINPYRYFPANEVLTALRDTAIYPNINRADYAVTIYPPVAQIFFFLVTRIGENVITMKLALLACEAGTVAIIVLLLRKLGRPVTRVVAYVWHPLPIWEIANNGHIDALMIALMMLGIWLALTGRPLRGAASIALGALAKPFAVLALPVVWRQWDWKAPLIVLAVIALSYAPYLTVGWGVFGYLTTGYLDEEHYTTGALVWPLAAVRWIIGGFRGDVVSYLTVSSLIIAAMAILSLRRAERPIEKSLGDINRLLLVFFFLLSPNFSWYFLALTPFVALIGGPPVWVFTVGAVLLQEAVPWDPHVHILIRKSVLYGAFVVACAYTVRREWFRRTRGESVSNERVDVR